MEGEDDEGNVGDHHYWCGPVSEVLPLLTEHVSEQQITHLSLLGKMSREEVMEDYAVEAGEDPGDVIKRR